jgi:hypothetical protein
MLTEAQALPSPEHRPTADLVAELTTVSETLTEVLVRETGLLQQIRIAEIGELQSMKNRLSLLYDGLGRELKNHPAEAVKLAGVGALREVTGRLTEAATENARAAAIGLKANQRVLDLIAMAACAIPSDKFSYGRGRLGYGIRNGQMARPIAIDRTL